MALRVKFLCGDSKITVDENISFSGLELYVWDKLKYDGIIRTGDNYDMEKFQGLVWSAYHSTLPAPCPDEVTYIVAFKLRSIRE